MRQCPVGQSSINAKSEATKETHVDGIVMDGFHLAPANPISAHAEDRPAILIVSDDVQLAYSFDTICDFLEIAVEAIDSSQDLGEILSARRPIAVITEIEGRKRDGYDVMMTVAAHDPVLPILLLTGTDSALIGAAEAVEELWNLQSVSRSTGLPGMGELAEFLFQARRRVSRGRLLPVGQARMEVQN